MVLFLGVLAFGLGWFVGGVTVLMAAFKGFND
jgi:hypothetical protein